MSKIKQLKEKYKAVCLKENKLRDERVKICDEINALEQVKLLKVIKDKAHRCDKIKYFVGGHPYGLAARVNYGILLNVTDSHAIIKTQTDKLHRIELIAEEAEPHVRLQFLNAEESIRYDEGKLKDGQSI